MLLQKSIEERSPDSGGWTPTLVFAGATCCLGSAVPAGYNIGVMSNAADVSYSHIIFYKVKNLNYLIDTKILIVSGHAKFLQPKR